MKQKAVKTRISKSTGQPGRKAGDSMAAAKIRFSATCLRFALAAAEENGSVTMEIAPVAQDPEPNTSPFVPIWINETVKRKG